MMMRRSDARVAAARNIQPVEIHHAGPMTFVCSICSRRINQANETVYADLNGKPFTYLCKEHA